MLHVIIGLLAIAAIVLAWRQMPPAWLVFASLYLLPSFAVGLVGLGRYAGECLPAVITGGVVLVRVPRRIVPVVLTAAATAMAAVALAVTAEGIIP